MDNTKLAGEIDRFLKEANKNYAVARSKALKGVRVHTVPLAIFYEWNGAQKKKGGQVKMERVMNAEKFEQWEAFAQAIP